MQNINFFEVDRQPV